MILPATTLGWNNMIVTVTERQTFLRCRWQWKHSSFNGMGLEPVRFNPAFGLGTLIHRTLYEWILDPDTDPITHFIPIMDETITQIQESYHARVGASPSDQELQPVYDAAHLAHSMLINYRDFYHQPLPDEYTFVQPEQTVVCPIPGTPHSLEGTFDGLLQSPDGTLYILEHKTYGQHPNAQTLDESDQFLAYIWLATQLGIGPVGGLLYDGLWKREKPPAGKKQEDLFTRAYLTRPAQELEVFAQEVAWQAEDMAQALTPEGRIYRTRTWQGCWDCDFRALCTIDMRGEDYEYALRTNFTHRDTTTHVKEES